MPLKFLKHTSRGGLLAAVAVLALPAVAAADAPDITSVSASLSGSTLTVTGTWAWTTHPHDCNIHQQGGGVGVAVDWNDVNAPGNVVTSLNAVLIDVGTAGDNNVHNTSGGTGTGFDCGTYNGTNPEGTFSGMVHTYSGSIPSSVCVLAYDVHANPDPKSAHDVVAGGPHHNTDNSAEENDQTPAGNVCTRVNVPAPPPPPPTTVTTTEQSAVALAPAIALGKTGPASANAGSDVPFTLTVTNPGNEPLTSVAVSDPRCNASAPALEAATDSSGAADASPATLDPGDTWTFTCVAHTTAGDRTLHNSATVGGAAPDGSTITAVAAADVPLLGQSVAPLRPGSSRLRGPSGCVSTKRASVVRVTGKRIARVSFSLDGRHIATRVRKSPGSTYVVRIKGRKLRTGAHHVIARVTYLGETTPKHKTLRLGFARCRTHVAPTFTG